MEGKVDFLSKTVKKYLIGCEAKDWVQSDL